MRLTGTERFGWPPPGSTSTGTRCSDERVDKVVLTTDGQTKSSRCVIGKTDKERKKIWQTQRTIPTKIPSRRAGSYAEERKAKVHQHGPKEGRELTDYEAGIRSGYLQCQSDHAGFYKYRKALDEGKTKEEALAISRQRGAGKKGGK